MVKSHSMITNYNRFASLRERSWIALPLAALLLSIACQRDPLNTVSPTENEAILVSIEPLRAILLEIVGKSHPISVILPPGSAPEIFDPPPSLIKNGGTGPLISVSPALDGWASRIPGREQFISIERIPAEYHRKTAVYSSDLALESTDHLAISSQRVNTIDPHFWSDPRAVKALVPPLTRLLCQYHPEDCGKFQERGKEFQAECDSLDREIELLFADRKEGSVVLLHSGYLYFMERYKIPIALIIEPIPGREPGPGTTARWIAHLKKSNARVIFREPQIPDKPVKVLSEATGIPIKTLDPEGSQGMKSYGDWLLSSARTVAEALR